MGDRRRRSSYSSSDEHSRGRDYPRSRDFRERSRYDRSQYGTGASRDASVKSGRGHSLRRESPYGHHAQGSAPSYDRTQNRSRGRDSNPGRSVPPTRAKGRGPYHDTFYEDMRMKGASAVGSARDASPARGGTARDYSREAVLEKRRKRKPRKALIAAAIVAAVVLVGGGAAFAYVSGISGNLHSGVDQNLRDALVKTDMANEPFYMLLLGTDGSAERDQTGELDGMYRSDSMMLARIDAPQKKATLVSIARDTLVDIPGYGEQKINAAFGFGGPALAVQTVSQMAGVPISHYAQVDFDGFSALVDALGGVEVDVPMEFNDADAGGHVDAGLHTLDGREALILCRARNTYADIAAHPDEMRAANQRLVLAAIAKKLLDSDIVTIAGSVQSLSRYVSTDMELTDIIGLAQALQGMDSSSDIYTAQAPTNSQYVDDIWYEYIDKKAWGSMMERIKQGQPPTEESLVDESTGTVIATAGKDANLSSGIKYSTVTVKNGTNHQGLAAQTRTKLMDLGFANVVVGDIAEGYDYPDTLVIYQNDSEAYEAQQIAELLGQGHPFKNDGSYLLAETDFLVLIGEDWQLGS